MEQWLRIQFAALCEIYKNIFTFIFPDMPEIGVPVLIISVLVFLYYLLRRNLATGFKMGTSTFVVLALILFITHHLLKILHLGF
jgi:hypothetical protein